MGKRIPTTVNARNWTAQEMSVHAEILLASNNLREFLKNGRCPAIRID